MEIGFSFLINLFPKKIYVTPDKGFALKCAFFIAAFICWQALI
jgi:hypothetical protein